MSSFKTQKYFILLIFSSSLLLPTYLSSIRTSSLSPSNSQYIINIDYTQTILNRSFVDRADDYDEKQVHIVYVIPSDRIDEELDINGQLATSVTAFQRWLIQQTNDRILRMDTFQGSLDITFCRLNQSDEQIKAHGAWVVTEIEDQLQSIGLINGTKKIYALYYGGNSSYACGGAAWPPFVDGQSAAMYLKAQPDGYYSPCSAQPFTTNIDLPKYWEFAMLHDLFHVLGAVSPESPNYTDTYPAHVSDSPNDLMYTGVHPWKPSVLDYGNDDYYGHGNPDLLDIKFSPFLDVIESTSTITTSSAHLTTLPTNETRSSSHITTNSSAPEVITSSKSTKFPESHTSSNMLIIEMIILFGLMTIYHKNFRKENK